MDKNKKIIIFIVVILVIISLIGLIVGIILYTKNKNNSNTVSVSNKKYIVKNGYDYIKQNNLYKSEQLINSIQSNTINKDIFKGTSFLNNNIHVKNQNENYIAPKKNGITLELVDDMVIQSGQEENLELEIVQGDINMYCDNSIDCQYEGYYMIYSDLNIVPIRSIGDREGIIQIKNNKPIITKNFKFSPEEVNNITFTSSFYKSKQDQSNIIISIKNNSAGEIEMKKGSRIQCIQL